MKRVLMILCFVRPFSSTLPCPSLPYHLSSSTIYSFSFPILFTVLHLLPPQSSSVVAARHTAAALQSAFRHLLHSEGLSQDQKEAVKAVALAASSILSAKSQVNSLSLGDRSARFPVSTSDVLRDASVMSEGATENRWEEGERKEEMERRRETGFSVNNRLQMWMEKVDQTLNALSPAVQVCNAYESIACACGCLLAVPS